MTTTPQHRRRPLSAHDIRNIRIRQIGFRKGYDPGEVEAILHRLAEEVATRDGQITTLAAAATASCRPSHRGTWTRR
jgi:DivIVA domain-containing protein